MEEFCIGEAVKLDSLDIFVEQLEGFVNTFKSKADDYKAGLLGANEKYSQRNLIEHIVECLV